MQKILNWVLIICAFVLCATTAHAECTSDQYAVGDNCYSCPANATCDGVNFNCDDGFYRNLAVCSACPPNSTCTSPTDFTCNPGTYLRNGQCNACPNNATCIGGTETFHCNNGWYKKTYECASCANHVCDGETVISCGEGYYLYNKTCQSCNRTMHCPAGSVSGTRGCIEGYYESLSDSRCFTCPTGYFCPLDYSTGANMHDFCAPGYYRTGNSCSQCPDGITCVGTYSANMGTCPTGTTAWADGRCMTYAQNDNGIYPDDCHEGFYADESSGACVICPVTHSTCTSESDFLCMAGYYKNGNECTLCPANSDCRTGSEQIYCVPGYWLNKNICDRCTYGHYCNNNQAILCPTVNFDEINKQLPDGDHLLSATTPYSTNGLPSEPTDCRVNYFYIQNARGVYQSLYNYFSNSLNTYEVRSIYASWKSATTGYYLAGSCVDGCASINQCTNKPNNSHYTNAGTINGNDCPWQCDDGYYRDGDTCAVCPAGMNCLGGTIVCPAGQYPDVSVCRTCTNKPEHSTYSGPGTSAGNDCAFTCDAGYYLENGECKSCGKDNYCPGDNVRYPCPQNRIQDFISLVPENHTVLDVSPTVWTNTDTATSAFDCRGTSNFTTTEGNYSTWCSWNGSNYYEKCEHYDVHEQILWTQAAPGYYLDNYFDQYDNLYWDVTPCTNDHPANSHYSDAGTPNRDGNSGNDCPWECDTGYGRTIDDTCELLCPTDIKLRADGGISINIYANRLSDPSLNILYQDVLCYVRMVPGKKVGTLNTEFNGVEYHFSN